MQTCISHGDTFLSQLARLLTAEGEWGWLFLGGVEGGRERAATTLATH